VATYVARSEIHGVGVFSDRSHSTGETVETSRILVLEADETTLLLTTRLRNYVFFLRLAPPGEEGFASALAAGNICFCNHAQDPSCAFDLDEAAGTIRLIARRFIRAGEELTIDYGEYAEEIVGKAA